MTELFSKLKRGGALVAALCSLVLLAGAGCESDGGNDGGGADVVGTWALYSGGSIQGNIAWYVHFKPDNTYTISDNANGSAERVSGTYQVSGNTVTGPFVNPGVGDGRIDATVTDGVIHLDFVEYWHTPNKVVPYTGTKI